MKRAIFHPVIVIAAVVLSCLPFTARADEVPSSDILNAAAEGLRTYIEMIPAQNLQDFGFKGKDQADAAVLGQAFHLYAVPPTVILDDKPKDMTARAVPTTMWQFMILSEGKGAAFLTVDKMGGKWVAVSIGSSGLAGQVSTLMETWPTSDGYKYKLITIFQASSDFLEISRDSQSMGMAPLSSARAAMGLSTALEPKEILDPGTVVNLIRPAVKKNIAAGTTN